MSKQQDDAARNKRLAIRLNAQGWDNRRIAAYLHRSPTTVALYLAHQPAVGKQGLPAAYEPSDTQPAHHSDIPSAATDNPADSHPSVLSDEQMGAAITHGVRQALRKELETAVATLPKAQIIEMLRNDNDEDEDFLFTTDAVNTILLYNEDPEIRQYAVAHPNAATLELMLVAAKDSDPLVKTLAAEMISGREAAIADAPTENMADVIYRCAMEQLDRTRSNLIYLSDSEHRTASHLLMADAIQERLGQVLDRAGHVHPQQRDDMESMRADIVATFSDLQDVLELLDTDQKGMAEIELVRTRLSIGASMLDRTPD